MRTVVSVTPIFNHKQFIRPHFRILQGLDENIALVSNTVFEGWEPEVFDSRQSDSLEILKSEFPHVRIVHHDILHFGGKLFNFAADQTKADVIVKLDVDMLLTAKAWEIFKDILYTADFDVLLLDHANQTIVYKMDLTHATYGSVVGAGMDIIAWNTKSRFVDNRELLGGRLDIIGGKKELIHAPIEFIIHHFQGWKPAVGQEELQRVESLPGFTGWMQAPPEIREMFI